MCEEFDDGHRNAEPRRSSSVADAEMFVDKRRTSRRDPQHPTPPHRTDIKLGDAQPGDLAHLFQPDGQEREFIDVASIPDLDDRIGTPPNENHRNARTALDDDPVTDLDDDLNVRDGVAHVRDVTDKVRADDANRFQALLLSAVGQSVIASDADGVITFWNAAAETMQLVLAYRATHDALTQLPNSASLRESLEVVLADADDQHRVAVAVVDIDHFKRVNDRSGRTTGDVALKCVAGRFRRDLRTTDIVAHVGGDEFVLVRAGVLTLAHARTLASDALDLFTTEFDVGGRAMSLTASIGVGLSATGDTPASLIRDADNAMYQAKRDGRNRINVFDHLARASADRQQQIVDALPAAHADRLLRLEYQPVLDLSTSEVAGFEALLRWAHPELGNIAPDVFIPLAESTGLIVDIGRWVFNTALDQIATWRAEPGVPSAPAARRSAIPAASWSTSSTSTVRSSTGSTEPGPTELGTPPRSYERCSPSPTRSPSTSSPKASNTPNKPTC